MSELKAVPTFDPNKKYTWAPENEFVLSGVEFGVLLNSLRAIVSTKEAQTILLAARAAEMIEGVLVNNVENGSIVEALEAKTNS